MAQFDVYINPGRKTKKAFPLLLDIQSNFLTSLTTRIVIPLGVSTVLNQNIMGKLTPQIDYRGEELYLMTNQIFTIQNRLLQNPIGSLSESRHTILNALDFAITGV